MTTNKSHSEKHYLTSDTTKGAIKIDINVEIPVCYANDSIRDSIRNVIITQLFGSDYIPFGNDSIVNIFAKDLITEYKNTNEPMVQQLDSTSFYSFNNEHTLEGFSLLNDQNIYSYGINRYVFMGGAHGLNNLNYYNFNLKTGRLITEIDIFDEGFQQALIEIIKNRIIEQNNEDASLKSITSLEDTDFWIDAIKPNGNFYLTDESINYVFNPYEIAPFYMGITEVILSYDKLKSILKSNNIIQYLIEKPVKK